MLFEHLNDQISAIRGPTIDQTNLLDCANAPETGTDWDFMTVDRDFRVVHLCGPRFATMRARTKGSTSGCAKPLREVMPGGISDLLYPLIEVCLEQKNGVQQLHTLYRGQPLTLFAYPLLSTAKTAVGVQLVYRPTARDPQSIRQLLVAPLTTAV